MAIVTEPGFYNGKFRKSGQPDGSGEEVNVQTGATPPKDDEKSSSKKSDDKK